MTVGVVGVSIDACSSSSGWPPLVDSVGEDSKPSEGNERFSVELFLLMGVSGLEHTSTTWRRCHLVVRVVLSVRNTEGRCVSGTDSMGDNIAASSLMS